MKRKHETLILLYNICTVSLVLPDCPAALDRGGSCRLAVEGPVVGSTVHEAASHHDVSYRIVSYFATGTTPEEDAATAATGHGEQPPLPPQAWRLRYSATLRYGAVILLNDKIVASFPAGRWHTAALAAPYCFVWASCRVFAASLTST